MKAFTFRSGNAADGKIVKINDMPFKEAWRIKVKKYTSNTYDIQLVLGILQTLKVGDKGILSFFARSLNSKPGTVTFILQSGGPKWTKLAYERLNISKKWKKYTITFEIKSFHGIKKIKSYKSGETQIAIRFGHGPQEIEIAAVDGRNYGTDISLKKVRVTPPSYKGSEKNAKWRIEANKRIKKIRKGNFSIKVIDENGKPVKNAQVKVNMTRHKFRFGSCINTWRFKDTIKYKKEFKKLFNMAVFESGMKWKRGWSLNKDVVSMLKWLHDNDIAVRGHNLVWPSWKKLPTYLKRLKDDKAGLSETVRDHIYYETSVLKNDTVEWDVMNEPFTNHDLIDILGKKVMVDWYKTAKKATPNNKMYINDFGILTHGNNLKHLHQAHYERTIKFLLDNGAPLEGIGMQSHFMAATSPENVLKILDRFAKFGIPIKITEYDFYSTNERLKAQYMRDFLTAVFSHSAVNGFIIWGFWDGAHWKTDAPIFRKDWSLKPSGKIYKELVFNKWWTSLTGKSDQGGTFSGRGFYGKYSITIKSGKKKYSENIDFSKDNQNYIIIVK